MSIDSEITKKIRRPYAIKLVIWVIFNLLLCYICYRYHTSADSEFSPIVSISLMIFISIILFCSLGIQKYIFDKSFSGKIVDLKVDTKSVMLSAFERKTVTRSIVAMTVECDDGHREYLEEMLPAHLTRKIPYKVGDRVYHIRGSKHTCRFPRNDTEKKYEPISVICPICGAINTLGSAECNFCEHPLPYDPQIK